MPCFSPIHGFHKVGGGFSSSRSGAYRDRPLTISCGSCRGCRLEYSRQWAVRCVHESQTNKQNCFLTLTYDQVHLPPGESLQLRDWQTFAKRLRKVAPFRFFHCGEYGDLTNRPHFHALIFGQDFRKNSTECGKSQTGETQYTSPLISEKWGMGRHTIGTLNFKSAAYCARYILKKVNGPQAELHYQNLNEITGEPFQVRPEYASMSNGIGLAWIRKYMLQTYPRDYVVINGVETRPPKYYDHQCEKYEPEIWKQVFAQRIKNGLANASENTPERLRVREIVQAAKTQQLQRSL